MYYHPVLHDPGHCTGYKIMPWYHMINCEKFQAIPGWSPFDPIWPRTYISGPTVHWTEVSFKC